MNHLGTCNMRNLGAKSLLRIGSLRTLMLRYIQSHFPCDISVLTCYISGVLLCAVSGLAFGGRMPFEQPDIKINLGDTTRDWEVFEPEKGTYVGRESFAKAKRNYETGDYVVEFQGPSSEEVYTALWTPLSQFSLTVISEVTRENDSGELLYAYTLSNSVQSRQAVFRFVLRGLASPFEFELPSDQWEVRAIWKGIGDYQCLIPKRGLGLHGISPGETFTGFSIRSALLPTVIDAKGIGYGETFMRYNSPDAEVPPSVERAFAPYMSINDCVTGRVVGPGASSVSVADLAGFLKVSIEECWLEDGPARVGIEHTIKRALDGHSSGSSDLVLEALRDLCGRVEAVYTQKDSPMLSEAYALLYFNSEYLLAHYGNNSN